MHCLGQQYVSCFTERSRKYIEPGIIHVVFHDVNNDR